MNVMNISRTQLLHLFSFVFFREDAPEALPDLGLHGGTHGCYVTFLTFGARGRMNIEATLGWFYVAIWHQISRRCYVDTGVQARANTRRVTSNSENLWLIFSGEIVSPLLFPSYNFANY